MDAIANASLFITTSAGMHADPGMRPTTVRRGRAGSVCGGARDTPYERAPACPDSQISWFTLNRVSNGFAPGRGTMITCTLYSPDQPNSNNSL